MNRNRFLKTCIALAVLASVATLAACGSDLYSDDFTFAGTYTGTWVNVNNAADAGTSTWTIKSDGKVDGVDVDPTLHINYHVTGTITKAGVLTTSSLPNDGSGASSLNGSMVFDIEGRLTGVLTWGVVPPLQYRYTFIRTH